MSPPLSRSLTATLTRRPAPPPAAPAAASPEDGKTMTSKEHVLFQTIQEFFDDPNHLQKLRLILKERAVSLRRLESAATTATTPGGAKIAESYFAWLKAYGKALFDPFARSTHINFHSIDTSVGQLNFLRWAMTQSDLIDRAIDERRRRIKRRLPPPKSKGIKANVYCFDVQTKITF